MIYGPSDLLCTSLCLPSFMQSHPMARYPLPFVARFLRRLRAVGLPSHLPHPYPLLPPITVHACSPRSIEPRIIIALPDPTTPSSRFPLPTSFVFRRIMSICDASYFLSPFPILFYVFTHPPDVYPSFRCATHRPVVFTPFSFLLFFFLFRVPSSSPLTFNVSVPHRPQRTTLSIISIHSAPLAR